jgi:ABC-type Fe3+/spermidine/putrescine transport system ATPase subunit
MRWKLLKALLDGVRMRENPHRTGRGIDDGMGHQAPRSLNEEERRWLFDEPLSNLDAALRVNSRLEIAKLHQELRSTMIYVAHDQIEAMAMASI